MDKKQQGSGKKNKKANEFNDQQTKELIEQRLKQIEAQTAVPVDPLVKKIKTTYKQLQNQLQTLQNEKILSVQERYNLLFKLGLKLCDHNQLLEEEAYVIKRQTQIEKNDNAYSKDYTVQSDLKEKLELHCKDMQKKITQLNEYISSLPLEEKAKRDEMQQQFDKNINDVQEKVSVQEVETNVFEEENNKLREQLKQIIADYEEREKEFWKMVQEKEDAQKNDTQKYLKQFEEMQENAQQAIQLKLTFETNVKMLQQKRLKLAMFKGKFKEFGETLEQSYTTVIKLKEELIKSASYVKQKEEKLNVFQDRASNSDKAIITIMDKTNQIHKDIDQVKKQKDQIKTQILQVQKLLKEKQAKVEA